MSYLLAEKGLAMYRRPGRERRASLLLACLALLLLAASCGGTASEQSAEEPAGDEEQAAVDLLGHPAIGDEGAPVVLIEYADYQ